MCLDTIDLIHTLYFETGFWSGGLENNEIRGLESCLALMASFHTTGSDNQAVWTAASWAVAKYGPKIIAKRLCEVLEANEEADISSVRVIFSFCTVDGVPTACMDNGLPIALLKRTWTALCSTAEKFYTNRYRPYEASMMILRYVTVPQSNPVALSISTLLQSLGGAPALWSCCREKTRRYNNVLDQRGLHPIARQMSHRG